MARSLLPLLLLLLLSSTLTFSLCRRMAAALPVLLPASAKGAELLHVVRPQDASERAFYSFDIPESFKESGLKKGIGKESTVKRSVFIYI